MALTRRQLLASLAQGRRNILLIAVDDLNTDLGCYGHPLVQTPHIDALARRGVRFTRAYCQYPVCNASRTSLLTGRYPEQTRTFGNTENPHEKNPSSPFLPAWLRQQDYFTAAVGKIYHDGMDGETDWDHRSNPKGSAGVNRGEGRNLTGGKFAYFEWRASEAPDEEHPDGQTAAEVERLLAEKRAKPFFIACGFRKPHDKYVAPKKYFDLYPLASIPPAVGPADDAADIPPMAYPSGLRLGREEGMEFRRAYWACISFMDAQVGRVMAALDANGLAENTLVVFFSDHGLHLGEHDWWNKVALWERTTRVPMIVAGPGVVDRGAAAEAITELVDLFPTFSEWTGRKAPVGLMGRSLWPVLRNPSLRWERAAYTVVQRGQKMGRAVRTERFRYVEWDEGRGGVELYDHASDPNEFRNLRDDPAYAQPRAKLAALLRRAGR